MLCDVMPPREILDVLHAAEAAGLKLPVSVSEWWRKQTCIDQDNQDVFTKEELVPITEEDLMDWSGM